MTISGRCRQRRLERVRHCRRPLRHGLERAKHRVKDRQCRWRHGGRYTCTVFSVTPCSLRPLQFCISTGCATSADYGNTRHGLLQSESLHTLFLTDSHSVMSVILCHLEGTRGSMFLTDNRIYHSTEYVRSVWITCRDGRFYCRQLKNLQTSLPAVAQLVFFSRRRTALCSVTLWCYRANILHTAK